MTTQKPHRTSLVGIVALIVLGGVAVWGIQSLLSSSTTHTATANASTPISGASVQEAVSKNDTKMLAQAIKSGADVNAIGGDDVSSRAGMTPLAQACFDGQPELVKMLLDAKAKVETRSTDGRTPLMFAAGWSDATKVRMLLEAGARVDGADVRRRSRRCIIGEVACRSWRGRQREQQVATDRAYGRGPHRLD